MGMAYDDFTRTTPAEFAACAGAFTEARERDRRERWERWERMRTHAAIWIAPHLTRRVEPRKLLPLPWDRVAPTEDAKAEKLTPEQRRQRVEGLMACAAMISRTPTAK